MPEKHKRDSLFDPLPQSLAKRKRKKMVEENQKKFEKGRKRKSEEMEQDSRRDVPSFPTSERARQEDREANFFVLFLCPLIGKWETTGNPRATKKNLNGTS